MHVFVRNISCKAALIIVLMILAVSLLKGSEDRVYIDPHSKNSDLRNGTINNPFASWEEINITSNCTYLIKRSTELSLFQTLRIHGKANITISAYGEGKDPIIQAGTIKRAVDIYNSQYIQLKNIHLIGNDNNVFGIRVKGDSHHISIEQCHISNFLWGVRLMGFSKEVGLQGISIKNTLIEKIADDGIFAQHVTGLIIDSCVIRKVNQKWFRLGRSEAQAPGDGVQLIKCNGFAINHCRIDRSDTGNKFCIIANQSSNGTIKNNKLQGPAEEGHGGAAVYLGYGSDSIKMINNSIRRSPCGLYCHARNVVVYRNMFLDNQVGAWFINIKEGYVLNNTFWNNSIAVKGANLEAYNNIFYHEHSTDPLIAIDKTCKTDYNCYFSGNRRNIIKNYGTLEAYSLHSGNGAHAFFADPLVEKSDSGRFIPAENSPCINKGKRLDAVWGVIYTPCDERVDVGAIERCEHLE